MSATTITCEPLDGRLSSLRARVLRGREVLAVSAVTAVLSTLLLRFGPPGSDMAAHVYQKDFFHQNGLVFWNNLWYAGRYSFITYSPLYYPLAAVIGIRLLATISLTVATASYATLVEREWGRAGVWSARAFSVVWALFALSAAFPFTLGCAGGLLALVALQRGHRWRFGVLTALTLAASPLSFTLLVVLLGGVAVARRRFWGPGLARSAVVIVCLLGLVEAFLWALFPASGRFPFPLSEFAAAAVFCSIGFIVTFRDERTRLLASFFGLYLAACTLTFLMPSPVGENIARLRFIAVPLAVLALGLRAWRPRFMSLIVLGLALSWNVTPLAASFQRGTSDPTDKATYWAEPIAILRANLTPGYRVEALDTAGHWEALYLAQAGIPLTRGWYRQDDFPQNALLYQSDDLRVRAYLRWLRRLSARYIVLPDAPLDYSAKAEARIVRGHPRLFPVVARFPGGQIRSVSDPRPLVRGGPAPADVLVLSATSFTFVAPKPGRYSVGMRYSPYFASSDACIRKLPGGFMSVVVPRAGVIRIRFDVGASEAARALTGGSSSCDDEQTVTH